MVFNTIADPVSYAFENRNSIQGEILGSGGLYSVNYERILINKSKYKTAAQIGVSSLIMRKWYGADIPVSVTQLFSFNKHHAELGLGITTTFEQHESFGFNSGLFYSARIGYRFQKIDGKFLFRASFIPILIPSYRNDNDPKVLPWGALTFGYSF